MEMRQRAIYLVKSKFQILLSLNIEGQNRKGAVFGAISSGLTFLR